MGMAHSFNLLDIWEGAVRKKELLERVNALAEPICKEAGVSLWDVTFEKEGAAHVLTLFIDRAEGGVFIEDCETVSRAIDPALDAPEYDTLPPYTLSVSSAGVERKLTRTEHLQWAMGKKVVCTFYKGVALGREAAGVLISADAEAVTLDIHGEAQVIPRAKVSGMRMFFEF